MTGVVRGVGTQPCCANAEDRRMVIRLLQYGAERLAVPLDPGTESGSAPQITIMIMMITENGTLITGYFSATPRIDSGGPM